MYDTEMEVCSAMEFISELKRIGLMAVVVSETATDRDGSPAPDTRVSIDFSREAAPMQLVIGNPASAWYRSGLRTGDLLRALGGKPVSNSAAFFAAIRALHVGDTVGAAMRP